MANARSLKYRATPFAALLLFIIALLILFQPQNDQSMPGDKELPDRCITCHNDVRDMSRSHPNAALGCAVCHLGNPDAADEKNAHAGMVRNPSDLRWARQTCGKSRCHPNLTHAVKNSIMTSNAGIAASTLYQWDERATPEDSSLVIDRLPDTSLATSHLRKLCAGCHINKRENDLPGEFGRRGGGCNDCHLVKEEYPDRHPRFTVRMDIAVCEKCHNRSDRTALSYQGKFESEGYGTPYEQGSTSSNELSGGRYFYHIPADVHFRAGMVCIDCHLAEEVMGDGKRYSHLEEQVKIDCADCHRLQTARPDSAALVWKILQVNNNLRLPADSTFAQTSDGYFYANVFWEGGRAVLIRKLDGKKLEIPQTNHKRQCAMPGHERLSCQSCHSAYTPQCYGCHDVYDPTRKQLDKVSYEETDGHWSEGRSYLRFEKPPLGIDTRNRVLPFAPGCQVYMTELDDTLGIKKQKTWLTMAPFDPHSTRTAVPGCIDCHSNPKRLGLGNGRLVLRNGNLSVIPIYDAPKAGLGGDDLEKMVDPDGRITQRMSRLTARPFKPDEIKKIYRVSYCLVCHDEAEDVIYKDFEKSIRQYKSDNALPCRQDESVN